MKARTQYTDFTGTTAADISDLATGTDKLEDLADFFKLDKERFDLIGVSVYGTQTFSVSLLCVDKTISDSENEHIVSMMIDNEYENILSLMFKRLHIVLHNKFDNKYSDPELNYNQEVRFSDFHETEQNDV